MKQAQAHDPAARAFDLLYADGEAGRFGEREQALSSLLASEQQIGARRQERKSVVFAGALDAYDLACRSLRSGEKLEEAVARYADVAGRTWRTEDAPAAFRAIREDLAAPTGLTVRAREDVFLSLLGDRVTAAEALEAYQAMADGNPTPEEFDARRALLEHLLAAAPAPEAGAGGRPRTLAEATRDLQGLVTACAPHGGVRTTPGRRLIDFLEVSPSGTTSTSP